MRSGGEPMSETTSNHHPYEELKHDSIGFVDAR
jgi:hypothetical protein